MPAIDAPSTWTWWRVGSGLLILATAGFCAWVGLRTVESGRLSDRGQAARAIHLRGDMAIYYREAAGQAFDPRAAAALARRATELNPLDPQNWIQLARITYQLSGTAASQAVLQQGMKAVGGFDLHLQAAAFARLDSDPQEFWQQLALALRPLRIAPVNPELVTNRIQQVLDLVHPGSLTEREQLADILRPTDPSLLLTAVRLLLQQGDVATASVLWQEHHCSDLVPDLCDQDVLALVNAELLSAGLAGGAGTWDQRAVEDWNQAVTNRYLPQAPAAEGQVTDGDFHYPWLSKGFSWTDDGYLPLRVERRPASSGLVEIDFDGYHTGPMRLFHQWILLQPGRIYHIEYQASFNLPDVSGFAWELESPSGERLSWTPMRTPSALQSGSGDLLAPSLAGPVILAAVYQRDPGQVPARGTLQVAEVGLVAAPRP